ncbi:2-phospho-L-lactate guanylyltransferase [Microbacterium aoyamense]|uniref:2-phospho-L-lactate guanylyltransferase n=1 Tax=Microbacterium aoyamense TaxID=344166 RepID=A0ABP5AVI9_9MICO|nr:2-phospho-L-lactate guanylyltransferase [Microbacterium aoyamense]
MTARWTVVVPVKPADRGKSRLEVPGVDRVLLARAIALDTIAAAAQIADVVVVGDDGGLVLQALDIPGLRFVPEDEPAGLDAAVAVGMRGITGHRAALLGDLPALRPADLAAALSLAETHDRAVVADAEGTGSTLVTARPDVPWQSSFGDGSFARHVTLGCVALQIPDASTLRRDVDTYDQLLEARDLGLGPRTAALV